MKIKREVFNFNFQDYERFDIVELSFIVHPNCVQNFLNLQKINSYSINDVTYSNENFKKINVKIFAYSLYELCEKLGKKEYDSVRTDWVIRFNWLKSYRNRGANIYNYSVFKNGKHKVTTNSPCKLEVGEQKIYQNGLWRKLF